MSNFLIDEDTDLLAAEFVLGTLDAEERANAQSLLRMDHGFIAMVRIWERRFGELHLMVEPVEPEAKIWQRIKTKIAEIAPSEPVPEGKPATESTPGLEPAAGAGAAGAGAAAAGLAASGAAGAGAPADTDLAKPADAAAAGETSAPANGTAAEVSPSAGTEKPAETPAAPDSVVPTAAIPASAVPASAAETQPRPESPSELAAKSERGPVPKVAIPAVPPLPPPALKLPDKPEPGRSARGPEITINVIRSRGRWRVLGVCMTLLVMGLVALLAAWRFVPDRVPARLRPAQLMMSLGIQALPTTATAVRRAPPEAQFDE
jgi:hypothetical protein